MYEERRKTEKGRREGGLKGAGRNESLREGGRGREKGRGEKGDRRKDRLSREVQATL